MLCKHGCGREAIYKDRCAQYVQSCPIVRKKNSESCKKFEGDRWHWPKGKSTWNAGLKGSERSKEIGIKISASLKGKQTWNKGLKLTDEQKRNSKSNGGYRKGSGIGKSGWYRGFWCDSSWELAFIISHLENGIGIKRNTKKFSYEFEGKKYNYIPDFIVRGVYTEIKGYKTKRFDAKQEWFPNDLKYQVLYKNDMQIYLDYAIKKYGKDFISLYEVKC